MSVNSEYGARAAALLQHIGQVQAMREYARGNLQSQFLQSLPDTAHGFLATRDARIDRAKEETFRDLQMSTAQLQHEKTVRDFQDEQKIRDIFGETPTLEGGMPDFSTIGGKVSKISPERGAQYFELGSAQKTAASKQAEANLTSIAKILRTATPENWANTKAGIQQAFPHLADDMPDAYDQQYVEDRNKLLESATEWLNDLHKPTSAREPVKRLVNGKPQDVVFGQDGNWYLPGDLKTPLDPKSVTFVPEKETNTRLPVTKLVDGKRRDVVFGDDGNWYFPGNLKTPIDPSRVTVVPETTPQADRVTFQDKAQAETWKFTQLKALEDAYAASQPNSTANIPGLSADAQGILAALGQGANKKVNPMSQAELGRRKLAVENTYRRQLGVEPLKALPADWDWRRTPTPESATPAPGAAAAPATPAPTAGATKRVKIEDQIYDFTPEQWETFKAKAKEKGIDLGPD